ncbi:MAG: hypothetical protein OEQ13_14400, partial [Acidobacteriota bacterium]|nr:hypothetical protein [Acidobacteriota bacterium]
KAQGETLKVRWRDEDGRTETVVAELESIEEKTAMLRERSGNSHRIGLDAVLSARVHVEW